MEGTGDLASRLVRETTALMMWLIDLPGATNVHIYFRTLNPKLVGGYTCIYSGFRAQSLGGRLCGARFSGSLMLQTLGI